MADRVPDPVLDLRNGDLVTAQMIGSLPAELSDRSDSNPAVVLLEAAGAVFDKLIYQLNRLPRGVIQKALALCGVTLLDAEAATVTQSFTLSAPQAADTTIPEETQVSITDGSIVFETTSDLIIPAYTVGSGTVSTTSGSTTVTNSGSNFTTGVTWNGWQIQISGTWYTIASVTNATTLLLSSAASATVTGATWNVGPITGSVSATATTTGSATNVGAAKLTTLVSSIAGVASTTNAAAATGGAEQETIAEAVVRAPRVFATRDVACQVEDYAEFARRVLGGVGRAMAQANTNDTTATNGYVTVALLSPDWTTTSAVSTIERAAVVRDLAGRSFTGATLVDVAANIQTKTPTVMVYRKAGYDENTVRVNVAAALNTYLNPNTYTWGRTIYLPEQVAIIEAADGVDRVESINGIPCVTCDATTTTADAVTFTNNSASATGTAGNFASMVENRTVLIDATNKAAYLVVGISGATLTLDRAFAGASVATTVTWFSPGDTVLTNWYSLPYAALVTDVTSPAATVIVVGSV